jgi:hypothetical protein
MSHSMSDGGAVCPPPPRLDRAMPPGHAAARPAGPPLFAGATLLTRQIALRQMQLAALETAMIDACEAAVTGRPTRANTPAGPARWTRADWQRYLAAAMQLEAVYGPRIRHLRQQIGQLERLKALLTAR